MNPEEALFQAVIDDPDDDSPRLVYADWLEEHGKPERAEFIRVECELARLPRRDRRRHRLRERGKALLAEHVDRWLKPLGLSRYDVRFRRGFPEVILDIIADDFLELAPHYFRLAPVRRVCIGPDGSGGLDPELVRRLADCPYLARLTGLDLVEAYLLDAELPQLAASPYLGGLRHLSLYESCLQAEGVRLLDASPHLRNLTWLNLGYNGLDTEAMQVLAGTTLLSRLRVLDVSRHDFGDAGVHALVASPSVAGLRSLSLAGCRLTPAGAIALAGCAHLGGLRRLNLSSYYYNEREGNDIRDEGVAALAASRHLGLRRLNLYDNGITAHGARALAVATSMSRLINLDLHQNRIGTEGVRALVASTHLSALRRLDLSDCGLDDDALEVLAASPLLRQLRVLELSFQPFSAAAVRKLVSAPAVRGLRKLCLAVCHLDDEAANVLAAAPHLQGLARLFLVSNKFGPVAQRALRDRFGDRVDLRSCQP
jgi:uncharacterized protein (TIGR02996 family)